MAQVVEHLPSSPEATEFKPQDCQTKQNQKKTKKKKKGKRMYHLRLK
jgi:hypothetical protein